MTLTFKDTLTWDDKKWTVIVLLLRTNSDTEEKGYGRVAKSDAWKKDQHHTVIDKKQKTNK